MKLLPGNAQHIGDRADQQDSFGFSDFDDEDFIAHGGCLMVLADGMGGLADGAIASRLGVEGFLAAYGAKTPGESIGAALTRALQAAQHAVSGCSTAFSGAGSTLVAAVVHRGRLYWISLGDSRLYLCRGTRPAVTLTTDHNLGTLLTRQVERGELDPQSLLQSGNLEALTEYLGAPKILSPDLESDGIGLLPGDTVIACSDGLYRVLTPAQIAATVHDCDPMVAAERLIDAVLRQRLPHQDNVTIAALKLAPVGPPAVGMQGFRHGVLLGLLGGWLTAGLCAAALGLAWHVYGQHAPKPPGPAPAPKASLPSGGAPVPAKTQPSKPAAVHAPSCAAAPAAPLPKPPPPAPKPPANWTKHHASAPEPKGRPS